MQFAMTLLATGAALWVYATQQLRCLTQALMFALIGACMGLHFQLLTGFDAQHEHFYNRAIQPLTMLLAGVLVLCRLEWYRYWHHACAIGMAGLVVLGAYRQLHVASFATPYHDRRQGSVHLIERLKQQLPPGSVVGTADPQVLTLLPALSTLWTFVPLGDRTQESNRGILQRYLIIRKLEGASIEDIRRDFETPLPSKKNDRLLCYILIVCNVYRPELKAAIEQLWQEIDLPHELDNRRLDFLVTHARAASLAPPAGWALRPMGAIGGTGLFAVVRTTE